MSVGATVEGRPGPPLVLERRGPVVVVTLNRPHRRNALNRDLRRLLRHELIRLNADAGVRAVVLTGAGTAFCAGVDLQEALSGPPHRPEGPPPTHALRAMTKPVIAAVNGPCMTGGLELALSCSFILASTEAVFADTHTSIGLIDGWGGSAMLPRLVGPAMATQMILSGMPVDASTALRIGLANEVVASEDVLDRAVQVADAIASCHPEATRRMLQLLKDGAGTSVAHALGLEAEASATWRIDSAEIGRRFAARTTDSDPLSAAGPE